MFRKLVKEQTDDTYIQFLRYTLTGSLAVLVDFYFLFVLHQIFHVHYLISVAIAYFIGIMVNFYLSTIWVFSKQQIRSLWIEFFIFSFIGIIGLGLVEVSMWFFTGILGIYFMISKTIATMVAAFWNFFARKSILY